MKIAKTGGRGGIKLGRFDDRYHSPRLSTGKKLALWLG